MAYNGGRGHDDYDGHHLQDMPAGSNVSQAP